MKPFGPPPGSGSASSLAHPENTRALFVAGALAVLMHGALSASMLLAKRPRPIAFPTIDVSVTDMISPSAREREREPEPAPPPEAKKPEIADPPRQVSPAHMEPARRATPPPAPAAPVLTKDVATDRDGFVTGDAGAPSFGPTENHDRGPSIDGSPSAGPPTASSSPPRAAPPPIERSRAPGLMRGREWQCPWPAEADFVDDASVVVRVTVDATGAASSVQIVSDPGSGFGREARRCAMRERYVVAQDRDGHPVGGTTGQITIRFQR